MTNDLYDNLGKKIKQLRIKHGLTQEQVADALAVTPGYISNVETGRSAMTLRMLMHFASISNVSLDHIIGSIDDTYHDTALDHELKELISCLSIKEKENLILTIQIWKEV